MVRDHRFQELFIRNRGLLSDAEPKQDQRQRANGDDQRVPFLVWIHGAHQENLNEYLGEAIRPAM